MKEKEGNIVTNAIYDMVKYQVSYAWQIFQLEKFKNEYFLGSQKFKNLEGKKNDECFLPKMLDVLAKESAIILEFNKILSQTKEASYPLKFNKLSETLVEAQKIMAPLQEAEIHQYLQKDTETLIKQLKYYPDITKNRVELGKKIGEIDNAWGTPLPKIHALLELSDVSRITNFPLEKLVNSDQSAITTFMSLPNKAEYQKSYDQIINKSIFYDQDNYGLIVPTVGYEFGGFRVESALGRQQLFTPEDCGSVINKWIGRAEQLGKEFTSLTAYNYATGKIQLFDGDFVLSKQPTKGDIKISRWAKDQKTFEEKNDCAGTSGHIEVIFDTNNQHITALEANRDVGTNRDGFGFTTKKSSDISEFYRQEVYLTPQNLVNCVPFEFNFQGDNQKDLLLFHQQTIRHLSTHPSEMGSLFQGYDCQNLAGEFFNIMDWNM